MRSSDNRRGPAGARDSLILGRSAFGHPGAGGSVGFADPEHGIGFGYAMNRMTANLSGDPRTRGLIRALYEALGVEPTQA
jgi:CubicO group peptidase (beta-lactamase class C family)